MLKHPRRVCEYTQAFKLAPVNLFSKNNGQSFISENESRTKSSKESKYMLVEEGSQQIPWNRKGSMHLLRYS